MLFAFVYLSCTCVCTFGHEREVRRTSITIRRMCTLYSMYLIRTCCKIGGEDEEHRAQIIVGLQREKSKQGIRHMGKTWRRTGDDKLDTMKGEKSVRHDGSLAKLGLVSCILYLCSSCWLDWLAGCLLRRCSLFGVVIAWSLRHIH